MSEKSKSQFFFILPFLFLIFFAIPIEHKYDKLFRFYSFTLIPSGLKLINFDPKIYFYVSDLLGIVFFITGIWQIRKRYHERGALFLALLFMGALASIIASPYCSYPVIYTRLLQFFTPLALFFFLAHSTYPKERIFNVFAWSIFGMGLFEALIAIRQYFNQHTLGLRLLGEQPLQATIPVANGYRWLFDHWLHYSNGNTTIYRAIGTMPHPNVMGGFFAVALMITAYFFFIYRKKRLWFGTAYFIIFFAMAVTYSRSAIFAYLISTSLWILWTWARQKVFMRSIVVLSLASGSIVGTLLHEQIYSRGGLVNYNQTSRQSDQERLIYQKVAIKMIQKHPVFGIGYEQFSSRTIDYLPKGTNLSKIHVYCVHNIFLLIASEMGLLSMGFFIFWVGLLVWRGLRANDSSLELALLWSIFIGFLFIGCCDYYPIVFQQGKLLFFGIAGLLARFGCIERKELQMQ